MLNIKIVATYNGDKDKVDKALLRPGRLAIDHTFGKLDAATATKLAKSLGRDVVFDKEMTLAEVYNLGDDTGYKEKQVRKIGFGV
jgi:ATP-dependent 26S proteasome regulatory subunit